MEGVGLPDGVVITVFNFSLIISELGIRAEDGASYLSFSGGLGVEAPSGLELVVTVKGLRFRVAGNPDAPGLKLDGFYLYASGPKFVGEGGGYYRDLNAGGVTGFELGFSATVTLDFAKRYIFGLDAIYGDVTGPTDPFKYFMFQAFYVGTIGPIAAFELTGARVLYARNMLPALRDVDREARELRYLKWYRDTNPLTVPGDRRLSSWRAGQGLVGAGRRRVGVAAGARQGHRADGVRAARTGAGGEGAARRRRGVRARQREAVRLRGDRDRPSQRPHELHARRRRPVEHVRQGRARVDGQRRRADRHAVRLKRPVDVRDRPARRPEHVARDPLRRRTSGSSRR